MIVGLYGCIGFLGLGLQVVALIHAIRTGRTYPWLWVILFFPLIGGLAYFFIEVLPDIRRGKALDQFKSSVARVVDPECELKRLRDELEVCDSHENRLTLAAEYSRLGRHEEAVQTYRESLRGHYAQDPETRLGLAKALFAQGNLAAALDAIQGVQIGLSGRAKSEAILIQARVLEGLKRHEEAARAYESLIPVAVGQEATCRYALLLETMGQADRARALFEQVVKEVARGPRHYQRAQAEWAAIAHQRLAARE
jgi:hypothetical protein